MLMCRELSAFADDFFLFFLFVAYKVLMNLMPGKRFKMWLIALRCEAVLRKRMNFCQ